ncbi:glycoside hydrolase family 5 protein [Sphingomonas crusticola]|uniref:glycoside hydrolase family 5 protein n=1 Tax=Sphingomonas crusticola TaxID=1697973 RepID=UPI001F0867A8|nr:glycoside hydrolase family 5 protein [Sphingomonas crusticola]
MRRMWSLLAGLLLAAAGMSPAQAAPPAPSAWDQNRTLGRGVNIIGYDPLWKDFRQGRFKAYHFQKIRDAGFSTVRIVLQSFAHMDAHNRLDDKWLGTLDWAISGATKAGLNVIVDEHDFNLCSERPDDCHAKLIAFWTQVARHLRKRGDNVLFELLNEPHAPLDAAKWNAMLGELIPLVRTTNPTRTLVIGPTQWNNFHQLDTLKLPEKDRRIIVTFHYYDPMRFTHQGASWVPEFANVSGVTCCTPEERARVDQDFDTVAAWSKAHDRPILLGEFGAREGGDMNSRVAWTSAVARSAERHGFAWAYWQFDSDFIVWDMKKDEWVRPILGALIPGKG